MLGLDGWTQDPELNWACPRIPQVPGRPGGGTGLVVDRGTSCRSPVPDKKPGNLGLRIKAGMPTDVGSQTVSCITLGIQIGRTLVLESSSPETQTWLYITSQLPSLRSHLTHLNLSPTPTPPLFVKQYSWQRGRQD